MKQRIEPPQLNELTDEQKDKLREWWKPEKGDWVCDKNCDNGLLHVDCDTGWAVYDNYTNHLGDWNEAVIKQKLLPILSIGQMIEILGKDWVEQVYSVDYDHDIYPLFDNELCDALWSAIKEVL
jgi:hypothetical protein